MRSITCDNHNGYKMTFSSDRFSPFFLKSVEGVYEHKNKVTISENTMTDGGTYQGSVAEVRNIIITILDRPDNFFNVENRELLYIIFAEDAVGTLYYTENGITKKIDYYVESITRETRRNRPIEISLLCPDPFFYSQYDENVSMSNWLPQFEFIHEFVEEGENIGERSAERLVDIYNETAADHIGMTIKIEASSEVTNPKITRVESDTHIAVGSATKPFTMLLGDKVYITTGTNDKHVKLLRNGEYAEINQYLTEDSDFIQLRVGHNNIGYSAESGEENMTVTISYRLKYDGA